MLVRTLNLAKSYLQAQPPHSTCLIDLLVALKICFLPLFCAPALLFCFLLLLPLGVGTFALSCGEINPWSGCTK